MKFCTKCGSKLEEGKTVCDNCGYDFSPKKYKFFLTKNKKIAIASTIAVVIILACFIFVGKSLSNPYKLVARFQSDISTGNKSDLSKILYSNDSRLKIDDTTNAVLVTYFKNNPSDLSTVVENMKTQLINIKLIKSSKNSLDSDNFTIVEDGNTLLFFPRYKVFVKPSFIDVNTSIKGVEFYLNNKKIGTSTTENFAKELGPFIPGEYTLHAVYKGKYTSLDKTYNVDLINSSTGKQSLSVFDDINYLRISSDYPNAEIFVNNVDTKVKVSDAGNFGPVDPETKIYALTEVNGKKLKSDIYTVNSGDRDIDLSFSNSEYELNSIENQLKNLISNYTTGFCYSIKYGDFYYVEEYLYPGSSLYNEQLKYIQNTHDSGIRESIMSYSLESYTISDDNKSGTITTTEVYKITQNGNSSIKTFKYLYGFKYNEVRGYQLTTIKALK